MNGTDAQAISMADVAEFQAAIANRRCEARRAPVEVRWLRGARLKYGAPVEIVNISRNGILIRTDREFAANDTVVLELYTSTGRYLVVARALRSEKVSAGLSACCETAFRFRRPLETEKYSAPIKS